MPCVTVLCETWAKSRIYFYCILNFLSSGIGMCDYVPRISTDLSNTLNARVVDLNVGKLSETKGTKC